MYIKCVHAETVSEIFDFVRPIIFIIKYTWE